MNRILNDVVINFYEHPEPDGMQMNKNIRIERKNCKDKDYILVPAREMKFSRKSRKHFLFHFCRACQSRGGKIHFSRFLPLASYLSCHGPLICQFKSSSETIHMIENMSPKVGILCKSNSSSYPGSEGLEQGFILKQRHIATREWAKTHSFNRRRIPKRKKRKKERETTTPAVFPPAR